MAFRAALFDLDGVIISTHVLHYRSWLEVTRAEGIPFDEEVNRRLLGVSRMQSLEIVLERAPRAYPPEEKQALADRKNRSFLAMVQGLTREDLLPGALALIRELRDGGVLTAVCSGSRNARHIVELLGMEPLFEVIVDGGDITRTKPDPQVFELAARALRVEAASCLVVEDAAVGIQAARAAGMKALGVGDPELLGHADRVVPGLAGLRYEELEALFR